MRGREWAATIGRFTCTAGHSTGPSVLNATVKTLGTQAIRAERTPVLKTGVRQPRTAGSNPAPSAVVLGIACARGRFRFLLMLQGLPQFAAGTRSKPRRTGHLLATLGEIGRQICASIEIFALPSVCRVRDSCALARRDARHDGLSATVCVVSRARDQRIRTPNGARHATTCPNLCATPACSACGSVCASGRLDCRSPPNLSDGCVCVAQWRPAASSSS